MIVAPSILSADFADLKNEIASCRGAEYVHVDVMDGHFVPNITVGIPVVRSLRRCTDKILDVHLMIDNPQLYAERFCDAGADILTVHVEAAGPDEIREALEIARKCGVRASLSVKPGTPAEAVVPYIDLIDMILVMTVEPGFGGQSFMYDMLPKISEVRKYLDEACSSALIEVDGGINGETAKLCLEAGTDVLVAGNYVFSSENREEVINGLLSIKS